MFIGELIGPPKSLFSSDSDTDKLTICDVLRHISHLKALSVSIGGKNNSIWFNGCAVDLIKFYKDKKIDCDNLMHQCQIVG